MRKGTLLFVFVLLTLLLNTVNPLTVMAQEPIGESTSTSSALFSATACVGQGTDKQIQALARLIIAKQVSKEARDCYQALSDTGKARVFEAMGIQRGISVDELRKEALEDTLSFTSRGQATPLDQNWTQLIERAWWAYKREVVSVSGVWWNKTICDNDPSDVEYIFSFQFSTPVNDPEALRTISSHLGVDSMLIWYQIRYGGTKEFGHTARERVYECIGDSAVEAAGGVEAVRDHLKMFR